MTIRNNNDSIIHDAVESAFTPEELALMAAAISTPEQRAARAACITVTDKDGNQLDPLPYVNLDIVAENLHTYDAWKKEGLQVKRGEKAIMTLNLWRFTEKPNKAQRQAAADAGEEEKPDPHFYKKRCALFFRSQTEKPQPVKIKTPEEIREYNRMLAEQRRARKAAAQPASAPAPAAPAPAPAYNWEAYIIDKDGHGGTVKLVASSKTDATKQVRAYIKAWKLSPAKVDYIRPISESVQLDFSSLTANVTG